MARTRLSDVVRRWVYRIRRPLPQPRRGVRPLGMTEFEQRIAPAILPGSNVFESRFLTAYGPYDSTNNPETTPYETFNAVSAIDPNNPQKIVQVSVRVLQNNTYAPDNFFFPQFPYEFLTRQWDLIAQYTTDGGQSWFNVADGKAVTGRQPLPLGTPGAGFPQSFQSVQNWAPPSTVTHVSTPSIAFARDGQVYIAYTQDLKSFQVPGHKSGRVVVTNFGFTTNTPTPVSSRILYNWADTDRSFNAVVGVNNDLPTYTDPQTGQTFTDPLNSHNSGAGNTPTPVYVAWSTEATPTWISPFGVQENVPAGNVFDPNAIFTAATFDQGATFTTPQTVNTGGYFPGAAVSGGTTPQIAFTPLESTGVGRLVFLWNRVNGGVRYDISQPNLNQANIVGGVAQPYAAGSPMVFSASGAAAVSPITGVVGPIFDAIQGVNGAPDTPVTTNFATSKIDVSGVPEFALTDVTVQLALLNQNRDLRDFQINLVAPSGASIRLMNAGIDGLGNALNVSPLNFFPTGFFPTDQKIMGSVVSDGVSAVGVGSTWFSDQGARKINDPQNVMPFTGIYRPESPTTFQKTFGKLTSADGQLTGNWTLSITDVFNDRTTTPLFVGVQRFSVKLSSGTPKGYGADKSMAGGNSLPTAADPTANQKPNAVLSPNVGIGAGLTVAVDNTLGSSSPTRGNFYVSYTRPDPNAPTTTFNTDVMLRQGVWNPLTNNFDWVLNTRVNTDAASDNMTEGNRTQFGPAIAVDNANGTVVATWYDARNDASNARVARYFATSIDGGATFGPQVFLNAAQTAVDAISNKTVVIGPIPDNMAVVDISDVPTPVHGFGAAQSVVAYDGKAIAFWTGNQNAANSFENTLTAYAQYASGPRLIRADMGTAGADLVLFGLDGNALSYNPVQADGTRRLDGFRIDFDRPIQLQTSTTASGPLGVGGVGLPIPDDKTPLQNSIALPALGSGLTIGNFFVDLTIQHPRVIDGGVNKGDLTVTLIAPGGQQVVLVDQLQDPTATTAGANFTATRFDAASSRPITSARVAGAPFAGSWRPADTAGLLALLGTSQPAGNWTLQVVDNQTGQAGTLMNWSITLVPSTFTKNDLTVMFRNPTTASGQYGSAVLVGAIVPLGSEGVVTAANKVTSFYVTFATPQTAVGTYSYAIGPNIKDWVQRSDGRYNLGGIPTQWVVLDAVSTLEAPQVPLLSGTRPAAFPSNPTLSPFGHPFASGPLNLAIPDADPFTSAPGTVSHSMTIPALPAGQVIGEILVDINVNHPHIADVFPNSGDLRFTLTGPGGQKVNLIRNMVIGGVSTADPPGRNFTNTRFDLRATRAIEAGLTSDSPGFTGAWRPSLTIPGGFSKFVSLFGTNPAGQWTLTIDDSAISNVGTLVDWSLTILPGKIVTVNSPQLGNWLDLNNDGRPLQLPSIFPTSNDVFAAPTPTNGVPFLLPYEASTLPLVLGGPKLVGVNQPGPAPQVVAANLNFVPTFTPPSQGGPTEMPVLDITFDRLVDPTSFDADGRDILQIIPPAGVGSGPITGPFVVAPLGGPNFRIYWPAGRFPYNPATPFNPAYTRTGVQFASTAEFRTNNELTLNGPQNTIRLTFDRPMDSTSFTAADIVKLTGPVGDVAINGKISVTAVAGDPRSFDVVFPMQVASGSYQFELSPGINSALGQPVDTDQDAGLDVLRGIDPNAATYTTITRATSPGAVAITPFGTVSLPLDITDDFQIKQLITSARATSKLISLRLNILFPNDPDLQADLVAPSGARVRLFTGVGSLGIPPLSNFTNTVFDDLGATPIQTATPPFNTGPYLPQFPLSALNGVGSKGIWRLEVTNNSFRTGAGIIDWSLTLPTTILGTGLGEAVSDRFTAKFRIFTQDPTIDLTQKAWTAVGAATVNQLPNSNPTNSGRVNAVAPDPSDPSGNTVYVGGATGGVWKTTNFLTLDPLGPVWMPLTDLGSTYSLNIASILLIPINNDPNQTIVFVLTGAGGYPQGTTPNPTNPGTAIGGVGLLRSVDGGKSWKIFDSTVNADPAGNVYPIDAPQGSGPGQRDRLFFNANGFKIIADPTALANGERILYMAISGNASQNGVWRSTDTGKSWVRVRAGDATDVVLGAGSFGANGNLTRLYAAFSGGSSGVFTTSQATSALTMTRMFGLDGNSLIRQGAEAVPVDQPGRDPNFGSGRYVIAAPAVTNNPLFNSFYRDWLYVARVRADGNYDGLWMTKDFGRNWVDIRLPEIVDGAGNHWGTNDTSRTDTDRFVDPRRIPQQAGIGNRTLSLMVNPLNPNIVYLGGILGARVDTTLLNDHMKFVYFDYTDPITGAVITPNTVGGVYALGPNVPNPGLLIPGSFLAQYPTGFLNLERDPFNPFIQNATLRVIDEVPPIAPPFYNTARFANDGQGAQWTPFYNMLTIGSPDLMFSDITSMVPFLDPVTGKVRVLAGTRYGVVSGVDNGDAPGTGTISPGIGFSRLPGNDRNGNLQLEQEYSGAVQPSVLASDIAGALFYGMTQDNGYMVSRSNLLQTGDLNWLTQIGTADPTNISSSTGIGSAADMTGTGSAYQYRLPCCYQPVATIQPTDFFRVFDPGTSHFGPGVSRTNGLLQGFPPPPDDPANDIGQWPLKDPSVGYFTVNPIDPDGIIIGSRSGQVFRTQDRGVQWTPIFRTGIDPVDGSYPRALAYGAPNPGDQVPGLLNNFIYVGTTAGNVFVTRVGDGSWRNISNGIAPGSQLMQIVANPRRGSRDAFAVTRDAVYYIADSGDPADGFATTTPWVDITANLFQLRKAVFDDTNLQPVGVGGPGTSLPFALKSITSLLADWRYAIPIDPSDPSSPTYPVLYVAGDGGVFRSINALTSVGSPSWTIFPGASVFTQPGVGSYNIPTGGFLPAGLVTDLDLSMGNISTLDGQPQAAGALNMLVASTWGRGTWAIRLEVPASVAQYLVTGNSGARVVGVATTDSKNTLMVRFDEPVDPTKFTPSDILLKDPSGVVIPVTSVTTTVNSFGGSLDRRNLFQVTFPTQSASGFYTIVIGPSVEDFAGRPMNQDGDITNGETKISYTGFAEDAYAGLVYLDPANSTKGNLFIDMPLATRAGDPTPVTVSADAGTLVLLNGAPAGNPDAGYDHMVSISTSDASARLISFSPAPPFPYTYQFTNQDFGSRTFNFEFQTAGVQTVSVADLGGGSGGPNYNPAKASILVHGGVAKHLDVLGFPNPTTAGAPGPITVIARDDFKNAANGNLGNISDLYVGTITFSTTDPLVSIGNGLPADYTFTATDAGVHVFSGLILKTAGLQDITAQDINKSAINGTQSDILVNPAIADHIIMSKIVPNPVQAGTAATFTITAQDRFNNVATGYAGTLQFASDDPLIAPGSGLPFDYTFVPVDAGVHTFTNGVTFKTTGLKTLTATDSTNFLLFASQTALVTPAAAGSFVVSGFPNPTIAGIPGNFKVTALDPFGNIATGYGGTVHFTSTDPQATAGGGLPVDYKFTASNAGQQTFSATLKTAGVQAITATDTKLATVTGTQSGILVKAAAATQFFMTNLPANSTAGVQVTFTLTAKDPFGNNATGYAGLVRFTNTDAKAVPIPDYVFVAADAGVRQFPVTFKSAGLQTVTAFDATTQTMNASQTTNVAAAGMAGFTVSGLPASVVAGVPASFAVTARDAFGNTITGYTGTVAFTTSDPQVAVGNGLPTNYSFTSADNGSHVFASGATLRTAGTQTITATDIANPAFSDGQSTVVTPTVASRFDVAGFPSPIITGTAGKFTVTARDKFGNVATGYQGSVKFSSSDPAVSAGKGLPVTYPFVAGDAGAHTFSATLKTVGTQEIKATDLSNSTITGTQSGINVVPVPPPPPNNPPTISDVTDVAVPFNGSAGPILFTIADIETPVSSLVVTAASSNAGLLPVNKIALGGSGANRTVTLTPVGGAFGKAVVTLTVTDANGATATDQFTVTVPQPVGPPPPPGAGDPTIQDVPNLQVPLNGSSGPIGFTVGDAQTPVDQLVVTATSSNAALLPTSQVLLGGSGATRTVTLTPLTSQFGTSLITLTVTDTDGHTATDTFTVTVPPPGIPPIPPGRPLPSVTAVGTGEGAGNLVDVYRADGSRLRQFIPYAQTFTGGTRTAIARTPEGDRLIVAPGPGTTTDVLVFDLASGNLLQSFQPFEASFTGGMFVAAGDIDGDGYDDTVVTADEGGGPRARIFSGQSGGTIADFLGIEDPEFRGGARAAVGDFNGDGRQDLAVAAGFGGGPRLAIFDGATVPSNHPSRLLADFFVFEQTLRNGVYVAAGDVNGDGRADLIVGGGPGGAPRVMSLDGLSLTGGDTSKVVFNFFAGDTNNRGGVRVAVKNLDGDNQADLVVGDGEGAGSRVTSYPGRVLVTGVTPAPIFSFEEIPGFTGGVFVG